MATPPPPPPTLSTSSESTQRNKKKLNLCIQSSDDHDDANTVHSDQNVQSKKRVQFISHFHHDLLFVKSGMVFLDSNNVLTHSPCVMSFGGIYNFNVIGNEMFYLDLEPKETLIGNEQNCDEIEQNDEKHRRKDKYHALFQWKKLEIEKNERNLRHWPLPDIHYAMEYVPSRQWIVLAKNNYLFVLCLKSLKFHAIELRNVYADDFDLFLWKDQYLFFTQNQSYFQYHLMKIELKEIEKEMEYCDLHERVGRLKSMNNYSFHCLYTSKKSVVLASIQKKAKLLFSDDENSKTSNDFNLWVFGGKKDVSNEYRSIRVLNMTTTSTTNFMTRVHEFPVHDVDNHYRTNSYMALIPNKNLENNCDQQQRVSMLLSHVESMNGVDRIFFHIAHVDQTSSTNSTNSSKHKNFELERLVFNNIPVPPSIQKCVFRPFLHCYYDKYGHRKGIYIVNSHVMYFIHLDYESVSFCFQWKILLNNETHALSDIEIITQSIVYL